MALIKRPVCSKVMSDQFFGCPSCGHAFKSGTAAERQKSKEYRTGRLTIKETPEQVVKMVGVAIVLIVVLATALAVLKRPSLEKQETHTALTPGETGRTKGASTIAVDDAAWEAMIEALNADDEIGLKQLMSSGRVFMVPKATKVLVLDISLASTKVRVAEGQHAGKAGWVVRESLSK